MQPLGDSEHAAKIKFIFYSFLNFLKFIKSEITNLT